MQVNVSTHSRSKAAAWGFAGRKQRVDVSTHSRSKAAALTGQLSLLMLAVSTHSRSKAAAITPASMAVGTASFNSQPLEGGCFLGRKKRLV